jgi:hypothetical protein
MTNVTRTTDPAGAARPASPGADTPGEAKGNFDKLLESKKKDSPSDAQGETATGHPEGGREAAAGALLGRRERRDEGGGGGGGEQGQGGHDSSREPAVRALPGDVAMATPIRWEPAPAAPVRSAEMAARIEQIAQQIVQAAEVRLGPTGGAEARLELNLGALGNVHVSVARGEDGGLKIAFENASLQAGEALTTNATELLERLEGRGLNVQEITVKGTDQADFRLAPTRHAEGGSPADAQTRERHREQGSEDERQRRRNQEAAIPDDEDA